MTRGQKTWGLNARYLTAFGNRERALPKTNGVDRAVLVAAGWMDAWRVWPAIRGVRLGEAVEKARIPYTGLDAAGILKVADVLRAQLVRHGFRHDLLVSAFALVSIVTKKEIGYFQRKEQLAGAKAMLEGNLVEMATGEGKTTTALLAAATAALAGRYTHVITVNSYLAERDHEICAPVLKRLGISSGAVLSDQDRGARLKALQANVIYADNKELAFEYLREHIASERRVSGTVRQLRSALGQAGMRQFPALDFAIVDEADSVLVDEARTPLIIAESDGSATPTWCNDALLLASELSEPRDYSIDLRRREARLTKQGRTAIRQMVDVGDLPRPWTAAVARREMIEMALSALHLFTRDIQYMVDDDQVVIVDESTGRAMPDRAWQAGLHQLVEAKEGVPLTAPRTTTAKISFRSLFSKYRLLSGTTGTGRELAGEMRMMFQLRFKLVALHQKSQRRARPLSVCLDIDQKHHAIAREAQAIAQDAHRAVLVGTRSVEVSQAISDILNALNVPHVVLNARQSATEADIVAAAGQAGRITVATNMAGRGTDIQLADDVRDNGGLHVILTEFHSSARLDRQLIGRCARAGDPGSYSTYVAFDDELIETNAPELGRWIAKVPSNMQRLWVRGLVMWCQYLAEQRSSSQRSLLDQQLKSHTKTMQFAGDR